MDEIARRDRLAPIRDRVKGTEGTDLDVGRGLPPPERSRWSARAVSRGAGVRSRILVVQASSRLRPR